MSAIKYNEIYETRKIAKWEDLVEFYKHLTKGEKNKSEDAREGPRWIFRGQKDAAWDLNPRLERAVVERFKLNSEEMSRYESGIVRRFRRQAHHYISELPKKDDIIGWLSLMQHYGAPTRLLDWTYSFYAAVHFAIESVEVDKSCAVWALDASWLAKEVSDHILRQLKNEGNSKEYDELKNLLREDKHRKHPKTVRKLFNSNVKAVFPISPFVLNERIVMQQGTFLAPLNLKCPFMENIKVFLSEREEGPRHFKKVVIFCRKPFLAEAINELHRMNINTATLFPGLDGFARHLEGLIKIPDAIAFDQENIFAEPRPDEEGNSKPSS